MKYAIVAMLVAGCSKPLPPSIPLAIENAAAVEQYEALLEQCRQRGKAAGSYAVYESCANAVDAELCSRHGLRCKGGVQ